jgi:hypothetical protein
LKIFIQYQKITSSLAPKNANKKAPITSSFIFTNIIYSQRIFFVALVIHNHLHPEGHQVIQLLVVLHQLLGEEVHALLLEVLLHVLQEYA